MLECPAGAAMRSAVSDAYDACTLQPKSWHQPNLTFKGKLNHVLSNTSPIPKEADKALRRAVMPTLHTQMCRLSSRLSIENPKPVPGPVTQSSCGDGTRVSPTSLYITPDAEDRPVATTLCAAGPHTMGTSTAPIPTLEELKLRATVAIAADSTHATRGEELP